MYEKTREVFSPGGVSLLKFTTIHVLLMAWNTTPQYFIMESLHVQFCEYFKYQTKYISALPIISTIEVFVTFVIDDMTL